MVVLDWDDQLVLICCSVISSHSNNNNDNNNYDRGERRSSWCFQWFRNQRHTAIKQIIQTGLSFLTTGGPPPAGYWVECGIKSLKDQLLQLLVRFFKINLNFFWTPPINRCPIS